MHSSGDIENIVKEVLYPRHYAIMKGNVEDLIEELGGLSVEELTKAINEKDDQGNTLLHYAAKNLCEVAVRFLLETGADPLLENSDKKTSLDLVRFAQEEYTKDFIKPWVSPSLALIEEISSFFENVRKTLFLLTKECAERSGRGQYYTNKLFDYADSYLSQLDIRPLSKLVIGEKLV